MAALFTSRPADPPTPTDGDPAAAPMTDAELHAVNMAKLRRLLISYTILKIGVVSLIGVILYKVFGGD